MDFRRFFAAALAQLSLVVPISWPQEAAIIPRSDTPITIPRLIEPITFDGLSDEAAWRNIRSLPMIMMQPDFGFPPSEKTEVLIGFDDEFLWVAGRLYDREPDRIQAPSKKRDYMEANTDWFGVIFDTFNDKENGLGFFTTPSGLRWDGAVFHDAKPTRPMDEPINLSWNTFWDVKVAVNGEGWFVEMRIPFSSLRFQDQNGQVVMGLLVWRWIARKNEQIVFPAIYPKWGMMSGWKPSQAQEIRLDGVHSGHPLYITSYALGGGGFSYDLNQAETEHMRTKNPTAEVGLDLKYGLTSNLTLDLTLNPDFAQVEADDQQVNLTRFSLFFPEKRLFFQERAAVFDFNFGGPNRLFYTRRIGLYESEDEDEDARVVPIYGGVRLIGRVLYGWIPGEKSPLQSHSISAEGLIVVRNEDSTVESAELGPGWEFNFKSGWGGEVGYAFYRESVREEFSFADEADVPTGEYSFSGFRGLLRTPPGKLLSTMFMMDLGHSTTAEGRLCA